MSSDEKSSRLLDEFDPLCASDHALSSGQAPVGDIDGSTAKTSGGTPQATTPLSGENSATPPRPSEPDAFPQTNLTPSKTHAQSPSTPISEDAAMPTLKAATQQPVTASSTSIAKAAPIANKRNETSPIPPQSAGSAGMSSSGAKKKKKKKHKHHASSERLSKSRLSKPVASNMNSAQIGSQISEIDQFLQSLKMGNYDAALPQAAPGVPVVAAASAVAPATAGSEVTTAGGSKLTTAGSGVQRAAQTSLGLQLIGRLDSSSSSSDSESSSDSSDEEDTAMVVIEERESEEEEEEEKGRKKPGGASKDKISYPMAKNEINYRDLPPLESCDMPFPDGAQLLALGTVSHITEQLVVIQSVPNTDPVDEGTVLWSEDKKSLSVVFEIFGPVKSPYYSVHVHSPDHAHNLGLEPGKKVFVIPGNEELTKYVFTQRLLLQRGSDASWKDDTEVPEELQDFSDDEKEQEKKKKNKKPSTAAATSKPKAQVPRYSGDPKMQAYFPDRPSPRPLMGQDYPPRCPRPPPGGMSGGSVYFTPRGFVGFMPPLHPRQGAPLYPPEGVHHPPAMYPQGPPPRNMPPYGQHPPMPYYQPNMTHPPQNMAPPPLIARPHPPYYYMPPNNN